MARIKILPEVLSNKIAAGEVVERPASVVKELVENALDAGSTRIIVEIEAGGRNLIRVSDNGIGLNHDDALMALERYATSKISSDEDLFSIQTLGFRGEALPSIASVSRFTLVSRDELSASGTEIRVEGGKIKSVSETGAPRGTMISVQQLFFNTPARRKFLKTVSTEMGHIADTVSNMALGWSEVQFRLIHNGKTVKQLSRVASPADRAADVLGKGIRSDLHPVEFAIEGVSVTGWVASPRVTRSTARSIFMFVNGRYVRDRLIQHALFDGYSGRLMKGQYPVAVLYVTVPFDEVDVNVHPTKHEVRFAKSRMVHAAVKGAVGDTVTRIDIPSWSGTEDRLPPAAVNPSPVAERSASFARPVSRSAGSAGKSFPERPVAPTGNPAARRANRGSSEFGTRNPEPGTQNPELGIRNPKSGTRNPELGTRSSELKTRNAEPGTRNPELGTQNAELGTRNPEPGTRNSAPETRNPSEQAGLWKEKFFSDLRVIGQLHQTYILCESGSGMIAIDQHAAHERVVYEQLKARRQDLRTSAQRLLVPETVELQHQEAALLEHLIPEFGALGLDIEPFGGTTYIVTAIPTLLSGREIVPLIREILENLVELGLRTGDGLGEALDRCLMLMACHGAIRAHQKLSSEQIRALLRQLDDCENPAHCPHGRPTWIRWTVRDLDKMFKRIVS